MTSARDPVIRRAAAAVRRGLAPTLCALLLAPAPPAAALEPAEFYETCFMRSYDGAHLAAHPGQRVAALSVELTEFEDNLFARLSYAVRDGGGTFHLRGDCYDRTREGVLCHVCAGDSCEASGETFELQLIGRDRIRLVNDATGLTGEGERGRDRLQADAEHRVFQLSRAAPGSCAGSPE